MNGNENLTTVEKMHTVHWPRTQPYFVIFYLSDFILYPNQLIHGGATWKGALNRSQVTSGSRILEKFIPVIIHLVIENAEENWRINIL